MRSNFGTAIAIGTAICGIAVQFTCHAQSATSSAGGKGVAPAAASATQRQPGQINFAALEKTAVDPVAAASALPAAATDPSTTDPGSSTSASASTTANATAPASVAIPVKNDAVIKELAEMKKQFEQMAQMQAAIKARMARLESELDTDPATGDSVSAEKDADTLRSAETAARTVRRSMDSWPGRARACGGTCGAS